VNDAAGVTVNLNGATVLHRTAVHYPAAALQHGVQGQVSVEVKLDATGNVNDARVLSGPDELRAAALQSVLDWHFTRDAANGTKVVEISFELPKMGVAEGVTGGVQGRVLGGETHGVIGGIVGGVPSGAPANVQSSPMSSRILSIQVLGLSDEARAALLASLPVHEGDELTANAMLRTRQAVTTFDEHLSVRQIVARVVTGNAAPSDGVILQIAAPGVLPQTRMSAEGMVPPPAPSPSTYSGTLESPTQRIKVAANVQSAMIVKKVPPVYPQMAKSAGVEGVVRIAALIGKDGTMQELHVLEGPAMLIQAAMDAVKQWMYKPTMLNGDPVSVETTIDVNFTLNQ
jgi:TonB family protein